MEAPSGRIVARGLSMPHSPRIIDGQLYVLEGGRGLLLRIDAATGAKHVVAKLPGFPHGLAEYRGVHAQTIIERCKRLHAAVLLCASLPAAAQSDSLEDRLRTQLRSTVEQLRQLQDSQS